MQRRFAFLPLAFAFFLAALVGPFLEEASRFLAREVSLDTDARWKLKREIGGDTLISGPVLMVPVARSSASDRKWAGEVKVLAATLDINIEQSVKSTEVDGRRLNWLENEITATARFERPDALDVLAVGERLRWSAAYLRMPVPYPQTLNNDPALSIDGKPVRFARRTVAHDRVAFATGITGLPEGDVRMSMTMSGAVSITTVFPTGWTTRLTVNTDDYAPRFNDVPPDGRRPFWPGRALNWTMDGAATKGKVQRQGFQTAGGGFLGIQMREPDGLGPTAIYSDRAQPTYRRYDSTLRLLPLALALAALLACLMRVPGLMAQISLFMVFVSGTVLTLYLAPRIGPSAAWMAGAAMSALGGLSAFVPFGWKRALAMSAVLPLLWMGVWRAPYGPRLPNDMPVSILVRDLAQPILLSLMALALLAAIIQWAVTRRAKPASA